MLAITLSTTILVSFFVLLTKLLKNFLEIVNKLPHLHLLFTFRKHTVRGSSSRMEEQTGGNAKGLYAFCSGDIGSEKGNF